MEEREYVELRSEEVQEILGTPPAWLVRWGTFIVLLCFVALLGVAAVISYPDVIPARVTLTTGSPPVELYARTDGHIEKLLVHDQDKVAQGQLLMVLQSTARYTDMLRLDTAISRWYSQIGALRQISLPDTLDLGDLQAEYSNFVQEVERYHDGQSGRRTPPRRSSTDSRIGALEKSLSADRAQHLRVQEQLPAAREALLNKKRDLNDGKISQADYELEQQRLNALEQKLTELDTRIPRAQNELTRLRQNKSNTPPPELPDAADPAAGRLRLGLNTLRASLDKWKQSYLLIAPVAGQVSLRAAFFTEKQFVKQGDLVLAVVPPKTGHIFGWVSLPSAGSGKVAPQQKVIIKLDSYPYYEYGTLEGQVVSKSLVPKDNKYAILIHLPNGLRTSSNREIPFEQQLQGNAEIITEDKQFLERIYEQVFAARR